MARIQRRLRTGRVWRGSSHRSSRISWPFLTSRDSSGSPPPSPPQLSSASPPSSAFKDLGMPCSLDTPLSPTEQDDHTGIIPFEEFEDILNDIDEFDASSVWDALLAAAPLPEIVEAAQSSNGNDLSNRILPESDSQGTYQILTSKSVSIPIAASGSSKAINDSDVDNGGDDGDGSDGGKITAVLQVPVAELAEKEQPTQA